MFSVRRKVRHVGIGTLGTAALLLIAGSGQAAAAPLACGDTITHDTVLHHDLTNCPSNGIVIGADNITLHLNGHHITGNGKPVSSCPENQACDIGLVNDGHDDITLKDGSLRRFDSGVVVGGASRNRVIHISSSKNVFFGFVMFDLSRSLIRDSSGSGNLAPEGDGLGLFGTHGIHVLHNTFRRNAQIGIHVADSTHNLIKGNDFSSRTSDFGVLIDGNRNRVSRNHCVNNGACVLVATGNHNEIVRNRASGGVNGMAVEMGQHNLLAHNFIRHPSRQGIYLGLKSPLIGGGENIVRRNRVRGSESDGFQVNEKDGHSRLKGNVSIGSKDDGFDIESGSLRVTGNRALRNGGLGIEAVRGVADGGGNVAHGNGDPRQCTHVSCR
jgi:parallel beta-helix repeat protein